MHSPPWTRLLTVLRRHRLDQALADGARPNENPELALRSRQVTGRRHRRRVADAVERLLCDAEAPLAGRSAAAPVSRREVLEAEPNLRELAERLTADGHVQPRGVVLAQRLLEDVTSPIYTYEGPGALAHALRVALRALS
jgi:hypothetical protein